MKTLLIITILLLTSNASAAVKRGVFTSDGQYIMNHQMNDHKAPRDNYNNRHNNSYGYKPYNYYSR